MELPGPSPKATARADDADDTTLSAELSTATRFRGRAEPTDTVDAVRLKQKNETLARNR
ncbi:hypothetical protein [Apis mellifera filamentous virus]|uniref:hypothetical protein n=1 Tax=Apis mellifera filamentous virus TaxID=1100043 RepID=UPI0006BC4A06|nr:hypothetical protein APL35_gp163 [Apis mellifera filamentous virus]AKY03232.1 hypothetical protein [Apis mellifera filamentous virus]